jgi:hypothetical protein
MSDVSLVWGIRSGDDNAMVLIDPMTAALPVS